MSAGRRDRRGRDPDSLRPRWRPALVSDAGHHRESLKSGTVKIGLGAPGAPRVFTANATTSVAQALTIAAVSGIADRVTMASTSARAKHPIAARMSLLLVADRVRAT